MARIPGGRGYRSDSDYLVNQQETEYLRREALGYIKHDGSRDFTGDQSLGGNDLNEVNALHFELNPTHTHMEGSIHWNAQDRTLDLDTDVADVAIQVGQESVVRVTNKTGSPITNGSVVYINGSQGNRPTIVLADADTAITSDSVIGVATHDLADNATGYVTTFGLVRDWDTTGTPVGEVWAEGDVLWASSTAGKLTKTEPVAPKHAVRVGIVTRAHATQGVIFVHVSLGSELADLHDVLITAPADNQSLVYEAASGLWKNETVDHGILTGLADDDHTQYALLAGRAGGQTLIGGTAASNSLALRSTSNATRGKVTFGNSATTVYDEVNERFGIGVSSPSYALDVSGDVRETGNIIVPKTSGYGIKVDTASPTFGYHDIIGDIDTKFIGAANPTFAVYRGSLRQFQFSVDDEVYLDLHMPHDYLPGSDIYIHAHWSHTSTLVTGGQAVWEFEVSYAKGHNQAVFSAPVIAQAAQNASTTQYQHMIAEVQLSAASPSASQIDTDNLEPDGLLLIRAYLYDNTITVSSGGQPEPFLHFIDVHYQSTNIGTKAKAPGFYT